MIDELKNFKFEKATESNWQDILNLLSSAAPIENFTSLESYKNFFIVKDQGNIICCFAIDYENDIGILKSFAISKELQGKGVGKLIANKIDEVAKALKVKKLYATSWEAPDFWRKTNFKEISEIVGKDKFFIIYLNSLKTRYPQFLEDMKHFLLEA